MKNFLKSLVISLIATVVVVTVVYAATTIGTNITTNGAIVVDSDDAEALVVRKDGDAGDVMIIDTTNSMLRFDEAAFIGNNVTINPYRQILEEYSLTGNTVLTLISDDKTELYPVFGIFSYSDDPTTHAPGIFTISSRGSYSAPAAVQSGDILGYWQMDGYDGTKINGLTGVVMTGMATEPWTASAHGASLAITVTRNGASGTSSALLLDQDQSATFYGNVSTSGTIASTNSGSLGWAVKSGANTACNSTCTSACVFGWETSAGEVAVSCDDGTADKCLCAGGS